jgi:type IV pilus assembly protein PilY1
MNASSRFAKLILLPMFAAACFGARAEDIDLYSGTTNNSGPNPNVLIVVDNTSSNDAAYSYTCPFPGIADGKLLGMVYCALYGAMEIVKTQPALNGKLNVGLMSGGSGSNKGGSMYYPSAAPFNLPNIDTAGATAFQSVITAGVPKATGNAKLDGDMNEAWAFFTGNTGPSGTSYTSHIGAGGLPCQRSFIILIGASAKQGRPCNGSGCSSASDLAAAGATASQQVQINTGGSPYFGPNTGDDGSWIDEWARFMNQSDFSSTLGDRQNIVTYSIAAGGTEPVYGQVLASTGYYGGGGSFVGSDYDALVKALVKIFYEVQAVNSVFASPALPVNGNAQGTYLNQTFIGSFRPEANGTPRWAGNLKQYQFGVDTSTLATTGPTLFLADASWGPYQPNKSANSALSTSTGFFSPIATSFWTSKDTTTLPDSIGGFWVNSPGGSGGGYDSPDGEYVEKGGVSERIRLKYLTDTYTGSTPTTSRNLYTCLGAGCTSGTALSTMPFSTSNANLTSTALGITNPVSSIGVTNVSRNSSTGVVTLTLAGTPSPAIGAPTSIQLTGSTGAQYDGSLAALSPATSGTTVTYSLPAEYPPTPATGSYTATGTTAGSSTVSALSRSSNAGLITVKATLSDPTFGSGIAVVPGEVINLSDTSARCTTYGYCQSGTVLTYNSALNQVTYQMSESPSVYGGGGTAYIGASCVTKNNKGECGTISASNTNPPASTQANLPGLVRGTNGALTANNILMVSFGGGATFDGGTLPSTGKSMTVAGASAYNGGPYPVVGVGTSCSVTETHTDGTVRTYTGTATSGTTVYTVCLDLGASFSSTVLPSFSASSASVASTTATKQNAAATKTITSLTRGASNCPTSATATVTATTSLPHGFITGQTITVSSANPGANEGAYIQTPTITMVDATHFTYTVTTTPSCTDTKAGMSISYQQSSGGIDPTSLINWVRGSDNIGDESSPGNGITIRPSVHGDVVHSRPAVVNYGGTTGVVVFYGANDGVFRAINGNQPNNPTTTSLPQGSCTLTSTCAIGGVAPGGELWSFVPSEFMPKLQRLYSNSPYVLLAGTPSALNPQYKDYYFDGPTSVYQDTANNKTYIYLTARRGGRLIYALDVSTPTAPKFMWKLGCPNYSNNAGCSTGFSELGQTWSQPKVALLNGYVDSVTGKPKPVLIFGGGYDGNAYNPDGTSYAGNDDVLPPGTAAMGRGIFIVDALSGAKIWSAGPGGTVNTCTGNPCTVVGMKYSIAADITLLDTNFDGMIDRLYAADTGGNIWRVDLEPSSASGGPSTFKTTLFASLGGATGDATKRKFLFAPDAVVTKNFTAVLAGSGDREHPLSSQTQAYNTVNRFYMIQDTKTGMDAQASPAWSPVIDNASDDATNSGAGSGAGAPSPQTLFNATSQTYNLTSSVCTGATPCNGFYIVLNNNPQYSTGSGASLTYGPKTGEQVVNAPTTIGGFTYFGTNQPNTAPASTATCTPNLGNARAYKVNFLSGSGGFTDLLGGGLPPSPVAGLVTVKVNGNDTVLPFLLGGGGGAISGTVGGGTLTPCAGSLADCKSSLGGGKPPIPIPVKKKRTYWYRQIDQ